MIFSFFEKRPYLSWLGVITILIAIFYISSLTFKPSTLKVFPLKSIVYHIMAFFFLALFLFFASVKGKKKNMKFIVPVILFSIAYGITDELHQFFVSGRFLSILDVFYDTLGIIFATLIYLISLQFKK